MKSSLPTNANGDHLIVHNDQLILGIRLSDQIEPKYKPILETIALSFNVNSQNCYPSRRTIAQKLGLSLSRVSALVRACRKKKYIQTEARFVRVRDTENSPYRQTTNFYSFNLKLFGLFFSPKEYERFRLVKNMRAQSNAQKMSERDSAIRSRDLRKQQAQSNAKPSRKIADLQDASQDHNSSQECTRICDRPNSIAKKIIAFVHAKSERLTEDTFTINQERIPI